LRASKADAVDRWIAALTSGDADTDEIQAGQVDVDRRSP